MAERHPAGVRGTMFGVHRYNLINFFVSEYIIILSVKIGELFTQM